MPVVTIGENTADDFSGSECAQIKETATTNNYGGSTTMEVTKWDAGDHTHSLIKFSGLSNIPGTATVNSAEINLYLVDVSDNSLTGDWRRILRDWEEGTQAGADRQNDTPDSCCWNEYGSGNSWTTAGCLSDGNDRSATISDNGALGGSAGSYYTFADAQIDADTEDFIDGTYGNYGWHLSRNGTGNESSYYHSYATDDGTDGQRPYIEVDYTDAGGGTPIPVFMHHYKQQQ